MDEWNRLNWYAVNGQMTCASKIQRWKILREEFKSVGKPVLTGSKRSEKH